MAYSAFGWRKDKYTNYDSGLTFNPTLSAWWILNDWTLNK